MYPLLLNAPKYNSTEFLEYIKNNNVVVFDNPQWIVIENCKYHKKEAPWLTAFHKTNIDPWNDFDILWFEFGDWEWLKKAKVNQTVPDRFHLHLIKRDGKDRKKGQ